MATGLIASQFGAKRKRELSRSLRKSMTPAESKIWELVRRSGLGVKFRRQQIIDGFVVDFYCEAAKLVVEIDGESHRAEGKPEYDAQRSEVLKARGLKVLRIMNEEVLGNAEGVVKKIREFL
jgi:very-short-patch-repair endonuclease